MYAAGRDVALDLLAPDPLAPDPPALDPLAGALSIAVFALVVLNGLDGSQTPSALLVPTAGYLLAHYVSLQVTQGQATAYLISDPMETGASIFGTASWS